jgi:formate-dependent phosphoribosylglycinamide formyltransferase (GAR transformylase)
MNVIFIEPSFPANQREFVRGLSEVGARVIGIGERPKESLDDDLKRWMVHYERVPSVVDEDALLKAVRWLQGVEYIDRLEAVIEAHVMAAARVREACNIPGTSVHTTWLCRDKPSMKDTLRAGGIPCAQSTAATSPDEARAFAVQVGYPLILKPRDSAGAAGTYLVANDAELERAIADSGLAAGRSVAVEEFIEGHEGVYDTLSVDGRVVHEFAIHYYPNVLEAMRTRWISPQVVCTNRVDSADGYAEVKALGHRVLPLLGIGTSATHMEWFFGPKGLKFSEIACRPPGVRTWDLYCVSNDMDLYREWAMAIVHGRASQHASRRLATGLVALRPDQDGTIAGYEGTELLQHALAPYVIDTYFPPPGTPTQPVEAGYMANAWVRLKHPDYDELRRMLDAVGETVKVRAR